MAQQVKVNLGGGPRVDEGGNIVPGKMIEMVVDGNEVYIVSRPKLQGDRLTDVYLIVRWARGAFA